MVFMCSPGCSQAARATLRCEPGVGGSPARAADAFCHATRSVLALKIELYVPVTIPMSRASTKPVMVEPPKSTSASRTNTTVSDVFSERVMVCTVERLITWSKVSRGPNFRFSRTRANTTMVSWIENATEVRIAVTNSVSTSPMELKWPRIAQIQARTKTSWSSLKKAHAENRQAEIARWRRNANARYTAISAEATRIRMTALRIRSEATLGPMNCSWMSGLCVLALVGMP